MIRRSLVAAAVLAAGPAAAEDILLMCDATPFHQDSTHADIETYFGAGNVTVAEIDGPEGTVYEATVVFPDDPKRRIEVTWWDAENRAKVANAMHTAQFDTDGAVDLSPTSVQGQNNVRIGVPIADVQAANGVPFELAGYSTDGAGQVIDWKDGAMKGDPGRCVIPVRFVAAGDASAAAGSGPFASDSPDMAAANPYVLQIGVAYAAPEGQP